MSKSIIIFTPHPDDETLGAGGFLLKKKSEGYQLVWLILTHMKEEFGWTKEQIQKRNEEIKKVSEMYPFDFVYNLEFEPTGLDRLSSSEIMKPIQKIIKDHEPEIILLTSANDPHTDHQIAHRVGISLTKKFRNSNIRLILEVEILSESNFGEKEPISPNFFVDISDFFERKMEIMSQYSGEMGTHPFPRSKESLRALAILRGTQRGSLFAEAFRIIKAFD
jgi:LmbE family N-acetylglucosaminyl deacetylase